MWGICRVDDIQNICKPKRIHKAELDEEKDLLEGEED